MATAPGFAPNATSFYWSPDQKAADGTDYGQTQWGQQMLEQNPATAYYRYGQDIGVPDDNSAFGRWFKQQFGNFQTGYNAYTVTDPVNANIQDYANSLGGYDAWLKQFMQLAPSQRGEDAGSRGGGPARWINR